MRKTGADRLIGTLLACVVTVMAAACSGSTEPAGAGGTVPRTTFPPSIAGGSPSTGGTPASSPSGSPATSGGTTVQSLAGMWSGMWADSTGSSTGMLDLDWRLEGSNLTGTITIDGWSCLQGGIVTGTLSGSAIRFDLAARDVQVEYKGTVAAGEMSGAYSTNCDNTTGTWNLTKTG